jgi:hypothetical protein
LIIIKLKELIWSLKQVKSRINMSLKIKAKLII